MQITPVNSFLQIVKTKCFKQTSFGTNNDILEDVRNIKPASTGKTVHNAAEFQALQ